MEEQEFIESREEMEKLLQKKTRVISGYPRPGSLTSCRSITTTLTGRFCFIAGPRERSWNISKQIPKSALQWAVSPAWYASTQAEIPAMWTAIA